MPCSRGFENFSTIFFQAERVDKVAAQTGLVQRKRKLSPIDIMTALAFSRSDTIGYSDLASQIAAQTNIQISPQAISKKVAKSEKFFEACAKTAIEHSRFWKRVRVIELPGVGDIFLADSSTIALNRRLAKVMPGTGGQGPAATAKIHAVFNASSQSVAYLSIVPGKTSEHTFHDAHVELSKPGDLIIRDLGYYDAAELVRFDDAGRYFLSRVPLSVKEFTNQENQKLDLWLHLATYKGYSFEDTLTVGENGIKARVVAVRLPKEKWKERLNALRIEKGRKLTKVEMAQAKWNILITNLPAELVSIDTLITLYSWRWQCELLFKAWKSCLGVDRIKQATCKSVALAYIWARLLYAVILSTARGIVEMHVKTEIGLLRWHRRISAHCERIRSLIVCQKWLALAKLITQNIVPFCLPEKSCKTSSLENIRQTMGLDMRTESVINP